MLHYRVLWIMNPTVLRPLLITGDESVITVQYLLLCLIVKHLFMKMQAKVAWGK